MAQGRSSLIIVPREHGAWAMLIVPYIAGAIIAEGPTGTEVAGLVGVMLLFFSRAPLAFLLKSRTVDGCFGSDSLYRWMNFAIFAAAGTLVFLYLIIASGLWHLVAVAAAGMGLFLVHEWFVWRRRERSVNGELVGVALLTLTAPLAVNLSACASRWRLAATLWVLNAMFFGASVFYVKMRLRTSARRRKPGSMREKLMAARRSIVYMVMISVVLGLLVASDSMPKQAVVAFIPMLCYQAWGVISGAPAMTLKAEGVAQTVLSAVFALMLIAAYEV